MNLKVALVVLFVCMAEVAGYPNLARACSAWVAGDVKPFMGSGTLVDGGSSACTVVVSPTTLKAGSVYSVTVSSSESSLFKLHSDDSQCLGVSTSSNEKATSEVFSWTAPVNAAGTIQFYALCAGSWAGTMYAANPVALSSAAPNENEKCGASSFNTDAQCAAAAAGKVYDATMAGTSCSGASCTAMECCKTAPPAATMVSFTGYLVDIFCWDKPNHLAIDGAKLDTEPEAHTVHCLRDIQRCIDSGYALLEKAAGASRYTLKYRLDAAGNAKALTIIKSTASTNNFRVTVTGTVSGDTIRVSTLKEGAPPPNENEKCGASSFNTDAQCAAAAAGKVYDATMAGTSCSGASCTAMECCKTAPPAATMVSFTGYLVDIFCWDKPNHLAIDGAKLDTEPEAHTVHCLRDIQRCIDSGYALLEKAAGASRYTLKYRLDAAGNAKALTIIKSTASTNNFRVTVTGTVSGDTIAVTKLVEAVPGVATTSLVDQAGVEVLTLTTERLTDEAGVVDGQGGGEDGAGDGSSKTMSTMITLTVPKVTWISIGISTGSPESAPSMTGNPQGGSSAGTDTIVCAAGEGGGAEVRRFFMTTKNPAADRSNGNIVAKATCMQADGQTVLKVRCPCCPCCPALTTPRPHMYR